MEKLHIYIIQNTIQELSYLRYNMISKEQYHDVFAMTANVGSTIYVVSRLKIKQVKNKIDNIFVKNTGAVPEYLLLDVTESIMNDCIFIDTQDKEISKLKRIFNDIKRANEVVDKDNFYFATDTTEEPVAKQNKKNIHIPTLDELLDKINKTGIDSLDKFEKKLLKDYSSK